MDKRFINNWVYETKLRDLTKVQNDLLHDKHRFTVITAGRRSRKTLISLQKDAGFALNNPNTNTYICAPTLKQAKRIFWNRLKSLFRFIDCKISETEHLIYIKHNNSTIFVEGLDKPERIEGAFAVHRVHTTETPDIKDYFLQEHLLPVLADTKGIGVFEGCPDFRQPWYRDLAETAAGVPLWNPEIGEGIKQENPNNTDWVWYTWQSADVLGLEQLEPFKKIYDEMIFRQEFQAEFIQSGGAVYYAFDRSNLTEKTFDPEKDVYLCYDFNVDPMTIVIIQPDENESYNVVKEFVLFNSNTRDSSEHVLRFLQENNFSRELYITGDYAGNHRQTTANRGSRTDWNIIEQIFKGKWNFRNVDVKVTKSISNRTNALNALFRNMKNEIRMKLNKNECPYSYKDLSRQVYNDDGTLNDENGKIGHRSDAISYFAMNYYPIRREF